MTKRVQGRVSSGFGIKGSGLSMQNAHLQHENPQAGPGKATPH